MLWLPCQHNNNINTSDEFTLSSLEMENYLTMYACHVSNDISKNINNTHTKPIMYYHIPKIILPFPIRYCAAYINA